MEKPLLKRFDALEVATADLGDAVSTYKRNFGFDVDDNPSADAATIKVGNAEIRLLAGSAAGPSLASNGEGLAGVWLEAEDVDQVVAALANAGITPGAIRVESGRRILAIDQNLANHVPLFVFDRKA